MRIGSWRDRGEAGLQGMNLLIWRDREFDSVFLLSLAMIQT